MANVSSWAKEAIHCDELTVVADRGYYNGTQILACGKAGITACVPKTQTSNNQARGLFGRGHFIYQPDEDEYECPAGQRLIYRCTNKASGKVIRRYWSSACSQCSLKPMCTTGKERRMGRWEHAAVLEAMEGRGNRKADCMRIRGRTVEPPFGMIKSWLGPTHFQMKRL